MECRKTKTKIITGPIRLTLSLANENTIWKQTNVLWLGGWCEFSGSIGGLSYVKPNKSQIALDTQLKIAQRQNKGIGNNNTYLKTMLC